MERTLRPRPRIGYFGSSLAAYWPQFPRVKEIVLDTMERHIAKLEAMGCEIVRGGLVDRAERGIEVGDLFARESVDLIIGELMTYTASHVLVPIAQRNIAPYLTLALQSVPTVNYEQLDTETFTPVTGPMTAPEVSCAFDRSGLPFHFVVGGDFQESVWIEVQEWIEAAATKRALLNSRLGYLGHYYPGMLDMYTDFTMHQGYLGAHVEILEMCDLADRVNKVTQAEIDAKVEQARQTFLMPPPGYDRITAKVSEDELCWAAQVACAEDKLIADFSLDGLAYYYRGWNNNEYERIAAGMILGNSFATGRGIPCAGEADLKTCVAMFIMDHFKAGGSFCELYFFDYEGDFVIVGHDGPGQRVGRRHLCLQHGREVGRRQVGGGAPVASTDTVDQNVQVIAGTGDPGTDGGFVGHVERGAVGAQAFASQCRHGVGDGRRISSVDGDPSPGFREAAGDR